MNESGLTEDEQKVIAEFIEAMKQQEELPYEFAKILNENFWDLI